MESRTCLGFFFAIFISSLLTSHGYVFSVGGKDGWVVNPSEGYGPWASRNRFSINDTLVFKYKNGTDSVLVVNKQDYDACSASNPILKLEGGDSSYIFDRSGPFYFITGNQSNCQSGQKLAIVVLSPRTKTPATSPPPSTAPGVAPASNPGTAPSPSTTPGTAPTTSSPGPSPSTAPSVSPASPPGTAPSPSTTPGVAPTPTSPGTSPTESPPGAAITPSGADSPGNTPGGGSGGTTPPSPSSSQRLSSTRGLALGFSLLVTFALRTSLGFY